MIIYEAKPADYSIWRDGGLFDLFLQIEVIKQYMLRNWRYFILKLNCYNERELV